MTVARHDDEVCRLVELVRRRYVPDSPTHDHFHLERVAALATSICVVEGGDEVVAVCAAWLHDLHRDVRTSGGRFFVTPEAVDGRAEELLRQAAIPQALHTPILDAVHYTDRYTFSDRPTYAVPIEAMAVRDADNLDAIGAIGVARTFCFGGAHGIPLWTGEPVAERGYVQTERPASTIQHFHDKLLRLAGEFETPTAVRIARRRQEYMRRFVDEFMVEWREDFQADTPAPAARYPVEE